MVWMLFALLLLLSLAVAAVVWQALRMMHREALGVDSGAKPYDLEVTHVDGQSITLRSTDPAPDLMDDGRFGLQWAGGYAQIGDVLERGEDHVRRTIIHLDGVAAPPRGARVRIDTAGFPPHPTRAFGLEVESCRLDGALGPLPTWITAGNSDTWLIVVHGKGAGRAEALRFVGPAAARGWPVLIASYRNDVGAPRRPSGRYGYGRDEWEDLEVALQAALDRGARQVFLAGLSMGGAIIASFMRRSPLAASVCGLVLDSPMLDFSATIDHGLRERGMPAPLGSVLRRVLTARYRLKPDELDYMSAIAECGRPVLLFHGDADTVVPYALAERLVRQQPDQIELVTTPAGGHVRSWNRAPERYESELGAFFDRVARVERPVATNV